MIDILHIYTLAQGGKMYFVDILHIYTIAGVGGADKLRF